MTLGGDKLDPKKYEPNTVREKGSICPLIGDVCPQDPQRCGRWQPMNIIEMRLNVPQLKTVHMCVDDALRITAESILNILQAMVQPQTGMPKQINLNS